MEFTTTTDLPAAAAEAERPLWRNPDYLLLWLGQAVSILGSQASFLALPLLMLALTGSPVQAGVLGGLRGVAYLCFGLPAGALVDRWDRRRVMLLCDLGRALALGSVPLALLIGRLSAAQLYLVTFVEGTLFIFFGLAETACLTRVTSSRQLPTAVAQSQVTDAAATLIGPAFGGALYAASRALPFVADAISYGCSVLTVFCIRANLRPELDPAAARRRLLPEITEGLRWCWGRPPLRFLLLYNTAINALYGGWPLLLIELAKRQGAGAGTIGLIFAGGGAGTILGALSSRAVQRRFSVRAITVVIAWIFALTWPPYALAPNALALGTVNAVAFYFVPISGGTQFSYRLLVLPDQLQARVNSVFRLALFGGQTVGFVATGALLERYGPAATVWITLVPAVLLALYAGVDRSLAAAGRLGGDPHGS
ncbi:MAG TPA: MFS transporter [Dehalococcoidia bacterium]|nr:MFS transporter [Dehalococcoidia bacterium]